jgi:hypothetical protein
MEHNIKWLSASIYSGTSYPASTSEARHMLTASVCCSVVQFFRASSSSGHCEVISSCLFGPLPLKRNLWLPAGSYSHVDCVNDTFVLFGNDDVPGDSAQSSGRDRQSHWERQAPSVG